jgi:group I intron endonuclease
MRRGPSCGVYCIRNTANGRVYVGSSHEIAQRRANHLCDLRKGAHPNQHLQRAFTKYGEAAFGFEVLEECQENELRLKEQAYINIMPNNYNQHPADQSAMYRKPWHAWVYGGARNPIIYGGAP